MSGNNSDDANRLSLIDDFLVEEVLAEEANEAEDGALETILKDIDRAELLLRKGRLADLRAQIDRERAMPQVVHLDVDRMRTKLQAAANDPGIKMTLAARSAVSDGNEDIESLLQDLTELERDADDEAKG